MIIKRNFESLPTIAFAFKFLHWSKGRCYYRSRCSRDHPVGEILLMAIIIGTVISSNKVFLMEDHWNFVQNLKDILFPYCI